MARKVWIGILGFGLVLFILFDIGVVYVAVSSHGVRGYGALLIPAIVTWQVYLALMKRLNSKPDERIMEQRIKD